MFIADFHIHSKYSRATSRECMPETLDLWARQKGLGVIGTGDFTHPAWREELREKLVSEGEGLYILRDDSPPDCETSYPALKPRFIVSGEICTVYKKGGKTRRMHSIILLPGIDVAEALSVRLEKYGNLHADGRPVLKLDSMNLLEITLEVCHDALFIPAHIWTPYFSLFGAKSGFDDIHECFGNLTRHICALETGLSADPAMIRRLSSLDSFTLVSNSDAHSPAKLGREANIFLCEPSYGNIKNALLNPLTGGFYGTIEFFPEEGKYYCDGHRKCGVCMTPGESNAAEGICPTCRKKLTVGVLHRIDTLADRPHDYMPKERYERLMSLGEVIHASTGHSPASVKGRRLYCELLQAVGPELYILRQAPLESIREVAGSLVSEGIRRLRMGEVRLTPGYDGAYGRVDIFTANELNELK